MCREAPVACLSLASDALCCCLQFTSWYLAKGLACTAADGKLQSVLKVGDEVDIGCHSEGPLDCPKVYDGSLRMCQHIALLSVTGQADKIFFFHGSWITWEEDRCKPLACAHHCMTHKV